MVQSGKGKFTMDALIRFMKHQTIVLYYLLKTILLSVIPLSFYPKKSVKGELVLITGGANGLGRLMAVKFAELGARLVIWDVDSNASEETCQMVRKAGGQIRSYYCDVSDNKAVYETAEKVRREVGKVDILVNSAGIVYGKTLMELNDYNIRRVFDVNALANFWTAKAFLPEMMAANHGHIVSMSSISGTFGVDSLIDYSSSKHALNGFDESLRLHLIAKGCDKVYTTNCCTYMIDTGMFEVDYDGFIPIMKADYAVNEMMKAILTNTDVFFLPKSLYIMLLLRPIISPHALHHYQSSLVDKNKMPRLVVRDVRGLNGFNKQKSKNT